MKRYYVLAVKLPYGHDVFVWGSPWPPEVDWYSGERLFGPFDTHEDAVFKAREIEAGNVCLQGEW